MIELRHISKRYGRVLAVADLNLRVPKGQIFGFIGPNGAGKTTTIRMIGGLLIPSGGTIHIDGIDLRQDPRAAKQKIGFIPDRPYLYEKLTAMEFLEFMADLYAVETDAFFESAEGLLALFSLSDWADELIESFSHGMKQRLIMAAALLHEPDIVIVDEPMVGLDPLGIRLVKKRFRDLAAKGVTIFLSTHTLPVAEDLCHRIGVIHKGRMIAVGSPQRLKTDAEAGDADLEHVFLKLTAHA